MRRERGFELGCFLLIALGFFVSACPPAVVALRCGNGQVEAGEACDDGNGLNGDGCSAACGVELGCGPGRMPCAVMCGDGVLAADEACDTGPSVGEGGCTKDCQIRRGWSCPRDASGVCTPICGDGVLLGAERCEDGNSNPGDGCGADCQPEEGWSCSSEACAPVCGDGRRVGDEACDDGNQESLDGCSPTCFVSEAWRPLLDGAIITGRLRARAVWTGSEVIVWGGVTEQIGLATGGAILNPRTGLWRRMTLVGAPANTYGDTATWTGSEMIVFAASEGRRYNPATDTWTPFAGRDVLSAREEHAAAWTGSELIVWGGAAGDGSLLADGARYEPSLDRWTPMSSEGAPSPRHRHAALWTGREVLIWGGVGARGEVLLDGARYDPVLDRWAPMHADGARGVDTRFNPAPTWTGLEMIVWPGLTVGGDPAPRGARYDPDRDRWLEMSGVGGPGPRYEYSSAWTGSELIVWGGYLSDAPFSDGAAYIPALDLWRPVSMQGAPSARAAHAGVWAGTEMVVWGGGLPFGDLELDGANYDPERDAWRAIPAHEAFTASHTAYASAVWTGSDLLTWGGEADLYATRGGGRFRPETGLWTPMSLEGAPSARDAATAVWSGREMIIWGGKSFIVSRGQFSYVEMGDGAAYDLAFDRWTPLPEVGAPSPRTGHTAIWTGSEMIVWGGGTPVFPEVVNLRGASYDPTRARWTPLPESGAPSPRLDHTAVWTGREMIIWGGRNFNGVLQDGGRYDPVTGGWAPLSLEGAPSPRFDHTAVWTGTEMIIFGGGGRVTPILSQERVFAVDFLNDGGRYDPEVDRWRPLSLDGAPAPTGGHSAVWTGRDMLVWGGGWTEPSGYSVYGRSGGGRYHPVTDRWQPLPTEGEPTGRGHHVGLWTGTQMLIWGGAPGGVGGTFTP